MCKCTCDCANLLTIVDTNQTCRQCFLGSHAAMMGFALLAADHTVRRGGGTFARDRLDPTTATEGYAVGLAYPGDAALIPVGDRLLLASAILSVRHAYPKATHVGTWITEGNVAVDPVRIIRDFDEAMDIAREKGQKAIYSFAESKDMLVPFESDWAKGWDEWTEGLRGGA